MISPVEIDADKPVRLAVEEVVLGRDSEYNISLNMKLMLSQDQTPDRSEEHLETPKIFESDFITLYKVYRLTNTYRRRIDCRRTPRRTSHFFEDLAAIEDAFGAQSERIADQRI